MLEIFIAVCRGVVFAEKNRKYVFDWVVLRNMEVYMKKTLYLSVIAILGVTSVDLTYGSKRSRLDMEENTTTSSTIEAMPVAELIERATDACDTWVEAHAHAEEFTNFLDRSLPEMLEELGLSELRFPEEFSEDQIQRALRKELITCFALYFKPTKDEEDTAILDVEKFGLSGEQDRFDMGCVRQKYWPGQILLRIGDELINMCAPKKRPRRQ